MTENNRWYLYHVPRQIQSLSRARIAADLAEAEHDVAFVIEQLGLRSDQRVLEIGCGWGRHTLALARRGFTDLTSVDIAPEPLAVARDLLDKHGLRATIRQLDFSDVEDEPYHAILSLYDRSCCGFPTEEEDLDSLRRLARQLRPGGWLVFGINDWPFALPQPSQRWAEVAAGIELIEVIPDRVEMRCTDRVTLIRPDGQRQSYSLTRRHYYLPELRRLLAQAGLSLHSALHRLRLEQPYGDGRDGLFVIARRDRVEPAR